MLKNYDPVVGDRCNIHFRWMDGSKPVKGWGSVNPISNPPMVFSLIVDQWLKTKAPTPYPHRPSLTCSSNGLVHSTSCSNIIDLTLCTVAVFGLQLIWRCCQPLALTCLNFKESVKGHKYVYNVTKCTTFSISNPFKSNKFLSINFWLWWRVMMSYDELHCR